MTENEAIKVFEEPSKHIRIFLVDGSQEICYSTDMVKAFETGIQALEEIQAYRAIGTVEGYERAIESSIENYNLYREYKAKVQAFEAIGTIEEFKALKEKNEPKKVKGISLTHEGHVGNCPTCGKFIRYREQTTHCVCEQKLAWSEKGGAE